MMHVRSIIGAIRAGRVPQRSIEPLDDHDAQAQYVCDTCGEVVPHDEVEGDECPMEYDAASEAIGVPPQMVRCEGTLEPQEIEPWEDRDE